MKLDDRALDAAAVAMSRCLQDDPPIVVRTPFNQTPIIARRHARACVEGYLNALQASPATDDASGGPDLPENAVGR